jgi:rhamnosyltransferase
VIPDAAARDAGAICGVVVTYFPGDGFERRLRAIAEQVDALVVVDNSGLAAVPGLEPMVREVRGHYMANAENVGLGAALNQGVGFARQIGAAQVLFFDQDSTPLPELRREMARVQWQGEPAGIIGCNYVQRGEAKPRYPVSQEISVPVDHVITSGSLYDVAMLARLGPFRSEFFIDGIDIEYCWRALSNGYRVRRTTKPLLDHMLGDPVRGTVLGRRFGTSNHQAFRRYFMARNTVLLVRAYFFRLPGAALHLLKIQLKGVILLIALEHERRRKLGLIFLGLWHGLLGRMDVKPWELPA